MPRRPRRGVSLSVASTVVDELDGRESADGKRSGERRVRLVTRPACGGGSPYRHRLASPPIARRVARGRRVRLPVQLHRPSRYLDPGVPDDERALARRGTTLVGTVKSGALVEVLRAAGWVAEACRVRAPSRGARSRTASAAGARQSAAIVTAIVIGDRAGLDDEVQRRLQEAGTYHVIAISGGNIAILAGLLLGRVPPRRLARSTRDAVAIAVLVAYAALVGGGASVDRATLMAVVYFGARAFDQRSPPLNALALVAAILVASDPSARRRSRRSCSPSAPRWPFSSSSRRHDIQRRTAIRSEPGSASSAVSALIVVSAILPMFAASLAAEAMLFPVGAMSFSRVTFAGLALNFLAIPLMAVAQIAGMAVVPLALVSRDARGG